MKGKTIAFLLWTIVVIAGLVFIGIQTTKDQVYTGTNMEFYTGRTIQINAEKVTFQAVSSKFFVLRKTTGEAITGVPAPRPLGWPDEQYFVAGPQLISGGQWLFPDGTATIKITSDNAVTVRLIEQDSGVIWLIFSLVAILIWIFGVILWSD